jgi:hypothetical protein
MHKQGVCNECKQQLINLPALEACASLWALATLHSALMACTRGLAPTYCHWVSAPCPQA